MLQESKNDMYIHLLTSLEILISFITVKTQTTKVHFQLQSLFRKTFCKQNNLSIANAHFSERHNMHKIVFLNFPSFQSCENSSWKREKGSPIYLGTIHQKCCVSFLQFWVSHDLCHIAVFIIYCIAITYTFPFFPHTSQ